MCVCVLRARNRSPCLPTPHTVVNVGVRRREDVLFITSGGPTLLKRSWQKSSHASVYTRDFCISFLLCVCQQQSTIERLSFCLLHQLLKVRWHREGSKVTRNRSKVSDIFFFSFFFINKPISSKVAVYVITGSSLYFYFDNCANYF